MPTSASELLVKQRTTTNMCIVASRRLGLRGAAARRSATSALALVGLGPRHIFAAVICH
jgi:hypothetical protein